MKKLTLLEQLYNGFHLEPNELVEAEHLLNRLNAELKSRKPHVIEFTRVNSDMYGNPRYVCHFTNISSDYKTALKLANKIGGRKFNNKQYSGGIVFQSYNLDDTRKHIERIKDTSSF